MEAALKVISFNLKRESILARKNAWKNRKQLVGQYIRHSDADIIGVQELMPSMRSDIMELLDGYSAFGQSRNKKQNNEQAAIILRNQDTDLFYNNTFWLSKKPNKQGSRAYFSQFPRICTVCEVYSKQLGCMVRVFNTHFDHVCAPARKFSAKLILNYMHRLNQERKMPTILMGDLNAKPDSAPIRILSENLHHYPDIRLTNVYDFADTKTVKNTYHHFKGKWKGEPIDYIFVSEEFRVEQVLIDRSNISGRYPSDHYPLAVKLSLKSTPKS